MEKMATLCVALCEGKGRGRVGRMGRMGKMGVDGGGGDEWLVRAGKRKRSDEKVCEGGRKET